MLRGRRDRTSGSFARDGAGAITLVGVVAHAIILIIGVAGSPRVLPHTVTGSLSPLALVVVVAFLAIQRRHRAGALGAILLPLASVGTVAGALTAGSAVAPLPEALRSPWFLIHVPSCFAAYAAFVVAGGAACFYLVQSVLLKRRYGPGLLGGLPPLRELDRLMSGSVKAGFILLTIGIATGAVWAEHAWGRYWDWTPKQVGSLSVWLVFAAYLHIRVVRGWQGHRAAWLVLAGLVAIMVTYLGAGSLTGDPHYFP